MLSICYGQPEWALSSATHRTLKCNVAQHTATGFSMQIRMPTQNICNLIVAQSIVMLKLRKYLFK